MENVNDLQSQINKKAETKLKKEIKEFLQQVTNNPFWSVLCNLNIIFPDGRKENLRKAFWPDGYSSITHEILKSKLPYRIEQESKRLLDTIDALEKNGNDSTMQINEIYHKISELEKKQR